MPKSTNQEQSNFELLEGTPYKAKLLSVEEKKREGGISKKTGKAYEGWTNWLWKFEISEGEKEGKWCWAETEDQLTTRDDNLVKILGVALRDGEAFDVGEEIDTDDYLGLECYILVANRIFERNGEKKFQMPIVSARPLSDPTGESASGADPWASSGDEPPF